MATSGVVFDQQSAVSNQQSKMPASVIADC
jgi:hypothetical protein